MPDYLPESIQVPISQAASTTTVVAAVAGRRIKLVAAFVVPTTAGTFNFQSHTTTANKTGVATLAIGVPVVLDYNPDGWFTTTQGEALDLVSGVAVAGSLNYVLD